MSRPKALIHEEVPDTVIGEIARYLSKTCGIPGCAAVFHLEDARSITKIIINYNKNKKESN